MGVDTEKYYGIMLSQLNTLQQATDLAIGCCTETWTNRGSRAELDKVRRRITGTASCGKFQIGYAIKFNVKGAY